MRIGFPSISLNDFSSPLLFTNLQDERFSLSVGSRHGNCSPFGSPSTKLRPFLLTSSPVAALNMSRVGMPDTLYLELIFAYTTREGNTHDPTDAQDCFRTSDSQQGEPHGCGRLGNEWKVGNKVWMPITQTPFPTFILTW